MARAKANGIEIEYEIIGDGTPLLLIMGVGAQLIFWPDEFCKRLADRGFRVIRFDNRDAGLSTKLHGKRVPNIGTMIVRALLGLPIDAPYTLLDMADDSAALLDALDIERAHVVGASMGGMIAQTLAITHPHRLLSLSSIMSHTGETHLAIASPRALRRLFAPSPRNREEAMENAVLFYRAVGSTAFSRNEQAVRERAARAYERSFCPAGFLRQTAAILASGSRKGALRFVRVPSLVLHGTIDPLIRPAGGRATAKAIPGAKLQMIEGMGHDLPEGVWPILIDAIAKHAHSAASPN